MAILFDHPREYRWVRRWEFRNPPKLVRMVIWIADRASREDFELFLPFLQQVMRRYPAPTVPGDPDVQDRPRRKQVVP